MKQELKTIVFCVAAAALAALSARASTFTVSNSGSNQFKITRSGATNIAETVRYRTVPLSAFPGKHYTEKSGVLTFDVGETNKSVSVAELSLPSSSSDVAYTYQNGTQRSYRFELTDSVGFYIAHCNRGRTIGTSVPSSGAFAIKDVTIASGPYSADDRGYKENGYESALSSSYFNSNNTAPRNWLQSIGAELRMTLSMDAMEEDDAYEYLQVLFSNTQTCDDRSGSGIGNGHPGNPVLSSYMAGFEMETGSKDGTYKAYTFPVTSVGSDAGADDPWGYNSSDGKKKYPLKKQMFRSDSRADDGRILVPTNFTSVVLRLNASGSSGSDK